MKSNYIKAISVVLPALMMMECVTVSYGQNIGSRVIKDSVTTWHWKFLLEPYFMFANMKGSVGLGTLPFAEVDEEPADIFVNLRFGAMIYFEAYSPRWVYSSDMMYMNLGADVIPTNNINSGNAFAKQLGWEVAVLHRIFPILEGGIGLQLNSLKSELNLDVNAAGGPEKLHKEISETWVDPMIIARVKLPITTKLIIQVRPSIGGFGIGSDMAWQLQAHAAYRFSQVFQVALGYRVIDIDYEKGEGNEHFLYDMKTFGPVLRLGLNF
jgi:hypothetical protein